MRVAIHLTPKASRDRIEGVAPAAGGAAIKIKVTAAPERGRANAALIHLLAKAWGVAPSRIDLVAGTADRRKGVLLRGDPATLLPSLAAWAAAIERSQPHG